MKHVQKIYLALALSTTMVAQATASTAEVPVEDYVIKKGDTVTTILFRLGIGTPSSPHRLYGKNGWVERMNALNPSLDLSRIYPGETIKIPLFDQIAVVTPPSAEDVGAGKSIGSAVAPEAAETSKASAAAVKKEATAKAIEVSFFNRKATTPEDEELFKNLDPTPPAYLGVRIGKSLSSPQDSLLAKVVSYGLLAEVRGGMFEGLRLLYETTPKVTDETPTHTEELSYDRLLLGWAFEWEAPALFDLVHLTPRLGRYQVHVRHPTQKTGGAETLSIPNAPSLGLELDAEFAKYFYVVRFWGAADLPVAVKDRNFETTSQRFGIDIYLKGSGFTLFDRKISQSFLLYTSHEQLTIEGKGARDDEAFSLTIPMIGAGYTLNIN